MGELMGYVDQITSYGFSSTDLGNKANEQNLISKRQHALVIPLSLKRFTNK